VLTLLAQGSGDVAYHHGHMYVGGTTPESRAEWIAALDRLATLGPGAGRPGCPIRISATAMVNHDPDWVRRQQFLIPRLVSPGIGDHEGAFYDKPDCDTDVRRPSH